MKLGVLLATYNGEKFLREQLDSILNQTKKVDEIIISDDGSSDNTVKIIQEYVCRIKDVVIKCVINQEKHGVVNNFENAYKNSTADFLFLCDQDDVWKKNKVEVFLEASEKYPEQGLYFSNATLTDGCLIPIGKSVWDVFFLDRNNDSKFYVLQGESIVKRLSRYGNIVTGMSSAVRRRILERVFPLKPTVLHDEMIAYYCSINGGIVAINEETALYRQHNQNVLGITGSMFVTNNKRRNNLKGLIKYSDQNLSIIDSMYNKSKYFMDFDTNKQYSFLMLRFQFYQKKRDIAQSSKLIAIVRTIVLWINGSYKSNEGVPLKILILDLAMLLFVSTKKRRVYFKND